MATTIFFEDEFSARVTASDVEDIVTNTINFKSDDPGSDNTSSLLRLRRDLLSQLRDQPIEHINELDAAAELLEIATKELVGYGTTGEQILRDEEIAEVLQSLRAVLRRLGISLELPFRNFTTFRSYWKLHGMSGGGGWEARRNCIESLFSEPVRQLDELINTRLTKPLTNPVKLPVTTWQEVDAEIIELRRKFESAATVYDYRALGTNCVGVLEAVGDAAFSPDKHLRVGDHPGDFVRDRAKVRLDRFVEIELEGENLKLRSTVKHAIALAHDVKHELSNATRAGIAADAVILVAAIIRRIADPSVQRTSTDEIPF